MFSDPSLIQIAYAVVIILAFISGACASQFFWPSDPTDLRHLKALLEDEYWRCINPTIPMLHSDQLYGLNSPADRKAYYDYRAEGLGRAIDLIDIIQREGEAKPNSFSPEPWEGLEGPYVLPKSPANLRMPPNVRPTRGPRP